METTRSQRATTDTIRNQPWGDELTDKPAEGALRLYFINVNGLQLDTQGGKLHEILSFCDNLQVDVLGLAEHNTDTLKYSARQIIYESHRRTFLSSKFQAATSLIPAPALFKPGGTMLSVFNHSTGRVSKMETDSMGRWTTVTLVGKQYNLTVIAAYQVAQDYDTLGPHTAYTQQLCMIRQGLPTGSTPPTPRQKFIQDLDTLLSQCSTLNEEIILMGDFNETALDSRMGMKGIIHNYGLVDVMDTRHPDLHPPATFQTGKRRLDYVLATTNIASHIISCGYDAFGAYISSDHRGMHIDISPSALAMAYNPMARPQFRGISSRKEHIILPYLVRKYEYMKNHKVFDRIKEMETSAHLTADFLDSIDRDIVRASLAAEKVVKSKRRPGSWSVILHQTRMKLRMLQMCQSQFKTQRDFSHQIHKLEHELKLSWEYPSTAEECTSQIRQTRRELKQILKNDTDMRLEELKARAASLCQNNPTNQHATILRRLIRAEEVKQVYQKLRLIRGKTTNSTVLQRIDVPNEDGQWEPLTDTTLIQQRIQEHNRSHFRQADGTPWTIPPLSDGTNYEATGNLTDKILEGRYRVTSIAQEPPNLTQTIVDHMAYASANLHSSSPTITDILDDATFTSKLKTWNEQTSTSPSGMHLGHYKLLVTGAVAGKKVPAELVRTDPASPPLARESIAHNQENEEEDVPLESIQFDIRSAHLSVINACLSNAITLDRWTTVASVMLEKDPGFPKLSRLRVIHLFEADYNLILGVKWRHLIKHATAKGYLNCGQHAVPNSHSLIPVLMEEAQYEYCRLTRSPLIRIDNDAKACYDRIIPNMSNLCCLRLGLHPNLAKVHGQTLAATKYHLKLPHGVSDCYYKHSPPEWPVYGTGQGAGNSPAVWTSISTVLFDCHDDLAHGATFSTSSNSLSTTIGMAGYVDDSTISVNGNGMGSDASTNLLSRAVEDGQLWSDLLWHSGGTLSLPKCSYHFLTFGFQPSGAPFLLSPPDTSESGHLTLSSFDRTTSVQLKHLGPTQSHRTLGCYKSPDGSQDTQYDNISQKCNHYATVVAHSRLSQQEASIFYRSIFVPSVGYPLPACHFTYEQLHRLQAKAHGEIFAAVGYNRHYPHKVLFAPKALGGGGFQHFFDIQGTGQLKQFVSALRQPDTQLGTLFSIGVERLQRYAGVGKSVFQDTNTDLSYVSSHWFMSLREYLRHASLMLTLSTDYILPLQRQHDFYLMDAIIGTKAFTKGQLHRINFCRLYLNVELASDICLADGETLDASFMKGAPSLLSSRSTLQSVIQQRPDETSWRLWRKALRLWSHKGKLVAPLGEWIIPLGARLRQWAAYFHSQLRLLYVYSYATQDYQVFPMATTLDTQLVSSAQNVPAPISGSFPTKITLNDGGGWRRHPPPRTVLRVSQRIPCCIETTYSFTSYMKQQSRWEQIILQTLKIFVPITVLSSLLEVSTFASDGSHLETCNTGTFGWLIGIRDRSYVECHGTTFPSHHSSSYRSEANGLLSMLVFLRHAARFLCWENLPQVIILCDNEGLVKTATKCRRTHLSPLLTDWDLLREIQQILRDPLFATISVRHIKGHSDKSVPRDKLTTEQFFNVRADELATLSISLPPTYTEQFSPLFSSTMVQVHSSATSTVTSHLVRTARECRTLPHYREYLATRWNWDSATLAQIDWEIFTLSHRQAARTRLFTEPTQCKLICRLLPVGSRINRIEHHRPSCCPLCESEETDEHLLLCLHPSRAQWRTSLLQDLDSFFEDKTQKYHAKPELADMLRDGITSFLSGNNRPNTTLQESSHRKAWLRQTNIGWYNLFLGHLATDWHQLQKSYRLEHPTDKKPRSASAWLSALVNLLQQNWGKLWHLRNADIHGDDPATTRTKQQDSLWAQVQAVEALRPQLDPSLQSLLTRVKLTPPVTTYTLQQWLNSYSTLFQTQALAYTRASQQHMLPITHFFSRQTIDESP